MDKWIIMNWKLFPIYKRKMRGTCNNKNNQNN